MSDENCTYLNRGDGSARFTDSMADLTAEIRFYNVHNDLQLCGAYMRLILAWARSSELSFEQMIILFANEAMNMGPPDRTSLNTMDELLEEREPPNDDDPLDLDV